MFLVFRWRWCSFTRFFQGSFETGIDRAEENNRLRFCFFPPPIQLLFGTCPDRRRLRYPRSGSSAFYSCCLGQGVCFNWYQINGQRKILISGSIHYPRSTPELWERLDML